MANSPFSKKQLQGPPTGGEMGSLRGARAGDASKWYSKVPDPSATARPSTFHQRQLAKNPPGQRANIRKIQEDVLRESEEKRSRYRMGYDD